MNSHGVSVSLLFPMMKTMAQSGYDWDAFCEYAAIDSKLLYNAEARITEDDFERIVKAAALYTEDELFGLHQGQRMNISDLGVLGYVMLHSKTIGKALSAYQKYNFIVCSGFNADIEVQGQDILISLFLNNSLTAPSRHCIEELTVSFYQTLLGLSCKAIPVKDVQFMHGQPPRIEEYVAVFGVVPQFNQNANTLRFSVEILDYPVLSADTRLLGIFEAIAEEVRTKLTQGSVLTGELYRWIIECMPTHFPTLQDASKHMRMSVRTLQARLKGENTSYNRLANEVRKELALRYLAKPEYTISEIAYLLHFSEPSAFQSAFRKWAGAAPGEYRQRVEVTNK
ncbi:AraC family transcriptional regulator [Paenibacillus sp. IHBB 10380]|uniref:AraC family transcriptional regulator n=1 Tax=Paenibacillus sp. IHBB 10380 TaxID=1566358 RepID=UPI0005D8EB12|nr:AraC family transcriptional regulator [Paenibacillus sp. IHBB 10380]AJS60601.1 transcriptional regulator [Paenibacillus sp. IHBB 10380]